MHFSALDTYLPGASPLHSLDARVKVALAMLLVLTVVLVPDGSWLPFAGLQIALFLAVAVGRIGLGRFAKRSAVAVPFALSAMTVVFSTRGSVVWRWTVFGLPLAVTSQGLVRFGSILIRSLLSVQGAVLLAATTKFPDILLALRALRVPSILLATAGFLYRYLFVLADEAQRMMRAREARSVAPSGQGGGTIAWRARVTGGMAGSLFIRSYERSERIYDAMVARGYDGEVRALESAALCSADVWSGILCAVGLLVVLVVARVARVP